MAKYNPAGDQVWIKQFGSASIDGARGISTDQWGNVFIYGLTYGELEAGKAKVEFDGFLAKYNPAGDQVWLKQIGSASDDSARGISTDQWGNVFICGLTYVELETGQGKGRGDIFLAKYVDELTSTQQHQLVSRKLEQLSMEIAELKANHVNPKLDQILEDVAILKHVELPIGIDSKLIQLADEYTKGRKGNLITEKEAKAIIKEAEDSEQNISEPRKKTLAHIYA